jgi:lipopolysaccharide export system protein LptA
MYIPRCNRKTADAAMRRQIAVALLSFAATLAAPCAFALSTDHDQPMDVNANYLRTDQNKNTKADVSTTFLKGDVRITQGSIKTHSDEATIYQDNSAKAAKTSDAEANNKIKRVVMTGRPAHMEQVHDDDCSLMTADADTIDYHTDTDLADLKGHVNVIQKGKGEFHGEHMIYNTKTGEMQSGDNSPQSRVTMRFEPKSAQLAASSADNCGYPHGVAKKQAKKAADKPADKQ